VGLAQDDYPNLSALHRLMQLSGTDKMHEAMLQGLSAGLSGYASSVSLPTISPSELQNSEDLFTKRHTRLQELLPIRDGRSIPNDDDLLIGDARRLTLAILFIDICGFSKIDSRTVEQQTRVLTILNLFMAEMLRLVKKNGGEFEKNTGDGLMAYFRGGSEKESTRRALETAVQMHFFNDHVIKPRFEGLGLPAISFRVGIETGDVILANVGVRGDHHSIVAVGNTANIACHAMTQIENGIILGNKAANLLPPNWSQHIATAGTLPGFVIENTEIPFPIWSFTYRAPKPGLPWFHGLNTL
jgi:adenylate cyclase